MLKAHDKVVIREVYLPAVSSYQFKALGHRRLVGVVVRILDGARYVVDFSCTEGGVTYGDKVRVNSKYGYDHLRGEGFPLDMLEKV